MHIKELQNGHQHLEKAIIINKYITFFILGYDFKVSGTTYSH